MSFNIVLVEPEIPNNTGNIGRLSLASGSKLHLIKPFGFTLDDKRVKRAGLDYWKYVNLHIYENFDHFLTLNKNAKMAFFSSHGIKDYWSVDYIDELFLIFGKESTGLSEDIKQNYDDNLYSIPVLSSRVRSLNLANAASIVVYEGLRKLRTRT